LRETLLPHAPGAKPRHWKKQKVILSFAFFAPFAFFARDSSSARPWREASLKE